MPRLFICLIWALSTSCFSATLEFNSGKLPVQLVELYTSEGCSSCPKADRWLSNLSDDSGLWERFVPVAFHVDYWNRLGWEDRFSSSRYSRRQRTHRSEGNINSVYTPGFVVAGTEWRGWFSRQPLPTNNTNIIGNLQLRVSGNSRYIARFDQIEKKRTPLQLTVVILGMNLVTNVKHGENSGKQLHHDFVVLDLIEEVSNDTLWQGKLPKFDTLVSFQNGENIKSLAIAAWVSQVNNLRPIQSVGGYLKTP